MIEITSGNTPLSHLIYSSMATPRKISQIIEPQNAIEGAGVRLRRSVDEALKLGIVERIIGLAKTFAI